MKTDTQLRRDVQAELNWDPRFDARDIGIMVKDGVVTLTGHASIESKAPPDGRQCEVEDRRGIRRHAQLDADAIEVCMKDGKLMLSGEVAQHLGAQRCRRRGTGRSRRRRCGQPDSCFRVAPTRFAICKAGPWGAYTYICVLPSGPRWAEKQNTKAGSTVGVLHAREDRFVDRVIELLPALHAFGPFPATSRAS